MSVRNAKLLSIVLKECIYVLSFLEAWKISFVMGRVPLRLREKQVFVITVFPTSFSRWTTEAARYKKNLEITAFSVAA